MSFFSTLIFFCLSFELHLFFADSDERTDLKQCKVSHSGVEYVGHISQTDSGLRCLYWDSKIENYDNSIENRDFVEGKKSFARNYCRNPKTKYEGPWCYTADPDVIDELCNVPLCSFEKCRLTGAGVEFGGHLSETVTGRKCLKWSEKVYRAYGKANELKSEFKLPADKFPDGSRKKAGRNCRNPTGDWNGPWCFVEREFADTVTYELEYCHVPFCQQTYCMMGTRSRKNQYHRRFIKIDANTSSLTFSVRLWNPEDFHDATLQLALCVLPLSLTGSQMISSNNGLELIISNENLQFVSLTEKIETYNPDLLSVTHSTQFTLSWFKTNIELMLNGKSILNAEYGSENDTNETVIGKSKGEFSYISILGDAAIWQIEPCTAKCEEHVTVSPEFSFYKPMFKTDFMYEADEIMKTEHTYNISFFVRSKSTVMLELRDSPVSKYPYFRIEIFGPWNKSSIYVVTEKERLPRFLSSFTFDLIMSYWDWSEFFISSIDDRLQMIWIRAVLATETVFDIQHPLIRNAKWYSIASKSTAHWAFYCLRNELQRIPEPSFPECVQPGSTDTYKGTQSISESGKTCLPWVDPTVKSLTENAFTKYSRIESWNYCRTPYENAEEPFCYIIDTQQLPETFAIEKEYCKVRVCLTSQCKLSGIGLEYDGKLNVTKSGRKCKPWIYNKDPSVMEWINSTNSTDDTFCRNPPLSGRTNFFGLWCNTTDPFVPDDLCDVPDCTINDACTVIFWTDDRSERQRKYLVYPDWVTDRFRFKVKAWNPFRISGIAINFFIRPYLFISLHVGTENNTKVQIKFTEGFGKFRKSRVLQERVIPQLIPTSYWQGFWVRMPLNDIEFGYEGSESPIIKWSPIGVRIPYAHTAEISITDYEKYMVGINFPCSYCMIEKVMSYEETAFYPMNLWSPKNTKLSVLKLHLRTEPEEADDLSGETLIYLYGSRFEYKLILKINMSTIELTSGTYSSKAKKELKTPLLKSNYWTTIFIKYSERYVEVSDKFRVLLAWNLTNTNYYLRFYYFTIVVLGTITTWAANCDPPDLEAPPIRGNWSDWGDWTCSVPCGGGIGFQTRSCTNPRANIQGRPCLGQLTNDGECNKFECGCVNPETTEKARSLIQKKSQNFLINNYEDITLRCQPNITSQVKIDAPDSKIEWLLNGFIIAGTKKTLKNVDLDATNLVISSATDSNNGVYMCVMYPACAPSLHYFFVVNVVSLVVVDNKPKYVRQELDLRLDCHSASLQYIFGSLTQMWTLDDFLYIDYEADLTEVNYDIVYDLKEFLGGVWLCSVHHEKLNLHWNTSRFTLKVLPPPTLITYLIEEDATKLIFAGWNETVVFLLLMGVFLFTVLCVSYVVFWYWKSRKELLGEL